MKWVTGWLLAGMVCACAASEVEPESLERITARLDASGGTGTSLGGVPEALDAWIAAHPDASDAWIEYARFYIKSGYLHANKFVPGTLERANAALDRAETLAPKDPNVDVLRGHVLTLMGRYDDADAVLLRAEKRGGDVNPWLRLNRANLRLEQRRWTEALQDCNVVASRKDLKLNQRVGADECRIDAYRNTGDLEGAERTYRAILEYADDNAWSHGNFATFLLCWRDRPEEAVAEARRAREIMDYGFARWTEAAALTRLWSSQVVDKSADASRTWDAALAATDDPVDAYADLCGSKPHGNAVARAAFDAGLVQARTVEEAIRDAAVADELEGAAGPYGVYRMQAKSEGRNRGWQYLSSEPDYRDPRNVSLSFSPKMLEEWRNAFGLRPEESLLGKTFYVIGAPQRVRIDYLENGKPTGRFYYQTQIFVESSYSIVSPDLPARRTIQAVDGVR